jgi:polysaccharide biosynthesis transport protein
MELREYIQPLLKWWWLIVLATAIAGGASYLATLQQPQLYQSSTTLIIGSAVEDPNPSNQDLYLSGRLASYYVELSRRSSVRTETREALGLSRLPEISVWVTNNNFIEIWVTSTNPDLSQAVAAELANQLIRRTPTAQENEREFVNELLDDYQAAIRSTKDQIAEKQEMIGTLISATEIAQLQDEINVLEGNLRRLETNYVNLAATTQRGAVNTLRVVEEAQPGWPMNPRHTTTIFTAASIGLVLAAAAAYILEYMDDTVKTAYHVTKLTGLSVLSGIVEMEDGEELVTVKKPRAPVSESFRVLRTGIQFSSVDKPHRTLLVAGPTPREGKTTTAANLAVVMAQAGNQVLLVDADLRRPRLHRIFDLPNRRGLTSLLLEFNVTQNEEESRILTREMVQATEVDGLQLLTSGPVPPNPSELLGSEKMKQLLDALCGQYDFIILDSPPILSVTDAAVLSTQVDGTLLVVRAHKVRRHLLRQAVTVLQNINANLLGAVLNGIPYKSEAYRYYYHYRDSYYYGPDETDDARDEQGPTGKLRQRVLGGEMPVAGLLASRPFKRWRFW